MKARLNRNSLLFTSRPAWRIRPEKNQELVMKEIEEYVHSGAHSSNLGLVRDSVHWGKYFVSFYKLVSFFHLQLRLGFVN